MKAKSFSKALLYHLQWKLQLKKFLDGNGTFDVREISSEGCKFGKWLCSYEAAEYASETELREFCRVHEGLHKTAERVYRQKMSGNDAAARRELARLETLSMKLASLLTILQIMNHN